MNRNWMVLAALVVGLSACADFTVNLAVNSSAAALQRGSKALDSERDPRLVRDALPGTIKTLDTFLAAGPENEILIELTAQARAQYAFGFLEADLDAMPAQDTPERQALVERASGLYESAVALGLRWAAQSDKELLAAYRGEIAGFESHLATITKAKAGRGLYWAGLSLGSQINLNKDNIDLVAELPRAIALLKRSHELDPAYQTHGAALGLGVVYGSQTRTMGGDPERAKQYFTEVWDAVGTAPSSTGGAHKYLMADVLFARTVCVTTQDRPLFEKTLQAVLATPGEVWPEQRLANELARLRAKTYLAMVDDLF